MCVGSLQLEVSVGYGKAMRISYLPENGDVSRFPNLLGEQRLFHFGACDPMLAHVTAISDFMSKEVVTAYSHSNVSNAVRLMVDHNIGSVVVVDASGPIGVFSERDLIGKVLGRQKRPQEPILMEVMSRSFNSVRQDASLAEAAKAMSMKKGRLMVFDDGTLVGIVTATDIMRQIHRTGESFDISKVYSKKIFEVGPETSLEMVVQLMDKRRIGSVIVFERKQPSGIFTERDLLRSVVVPNFRLNARVGDLATRPIITAQLGIDGREAIGIMVQHRIKRLPLTESDKVVGIVTARDLVEAFASSS